NHFFYDIYTSHGYKTLAFSPAERHPLTEAPLKALAQQKESTFQTRTQITTSFK
ncbi:MAG: hypothetical protein Q9175_004974, partial [Cornicularia normoerica]